MLFNLAMLLLLSASFAPSLSAPFAGTHVDRAAKAPKRMAGADTIEIPIPELSPPDNFVDILYKRDVKPKTLPVDNNRKIFPVKNRPIDSRSKGLLVNIHSKVFSANNHSNDFPVNALRKVDNTGKADNTGKEDDTVSAASDETMYGFPSSQVYHSGRVICETSFASPTFSEVEGLIEKLNSRNGNKGTCHLNNQIGSKCSRQGSYFGGEASLCGTATITLWCSSVAFAAQKIMDTCGDARLLRAGGMFYYDRWKSRKLRAVIH